LKARKHRTETRSVQSLHKELSTELTPLSGKKAIFRDALKVTEAVVKVWGSERVGLRLSSLNPFNDIKSSDLQPRNRNCSTKFCTPTVGAHLFRTFMPSGCN